jgi:hypothetical protein
LRKNGKHSSTFGNHEIEKTQWEGWRDVFAKKTTAQNHYIWRKKDLKGSYLDISS